MSESDTEALLVPIFHQGMDKVLPQNSNNDVMHLFPTPGSSIDIAIGDPVPYTDLIRGYEKRRDARSMRRMLARMEQIEAMEAAGSGSSKGSSNVSSSSAPNDTSEEPKGTDAADIDAAKIRCPAAGAYAPPGSVKSSTVGYDGLDSIAPTYLEDEPRGTVVPPEEFEHLKSAQLNGRRLLRYPGRTLASGRNVPPYVAAESRLLPVDDEDLSEAERKGEHYARLRLYAGITNRMEAAMRQLELQVAAKRKERGVEETPFH